MYKFFHSKSKKEKEKGEKGVAKRRASESGPSSKRYRNTYDGSSASSSSSSSSSSAYSAPRSVQKELLDETYSVSEKQYQCVKEVLAGSSIFFTGSAGVGKSYVLSVLLKVFKDLDVEDLVALTASTGVAASNIGGITIHSWAGVGTADGDLEHVVARVFGNQNAVKRWRNSDILVIDEISMISAQTFDLLSHIGKRVRNDSRPFGGIQVVVCGDFFQLPPVGLTKGNFDYVKFSSELESIQCKAKLYTFKSYAWNELFHNTENGTGKVIILDQVFRQKDQAFVSMLNEIRRGVCSPDTTRLLFQKVRQTEVLLAKEAELSSKRALNALHSSSKCDSSKEDSSQPIKIKPTKLFGTNKEVDLENEIQLQALVNGDSSTSKHEYLACDWDPSGSNLGNLKAPKTLQLFVNAQVMLLKNLSPEKGLVNGSKGTIIGFSEAPDYPMDDPDGFQPEVLVDPSTGKPATEFPIVK